MTSEVKFDLGFETYYPDIYVYFTSINACYIECVVLRAHSKFMIIHTMTKKPQIPRSRRGINSYNPTMHAVREREEWVGRGSGPGPSTMKEGWKEGPLM